MRRTTPLPGWLAAATLLLTALAPRPGLADPPSLLQARLRLGPATLQSGESSEEAPAGEPATIPEAPPEVAPPAAEPVTEPAPGSETPAETEAPATAEEGDTDEATAAEAPKEATASATEPAAPAITGTRVHRSRPWTHELLAGLIAGGLSLPATAILSGAIGRGPGNLLAAALPAALLYLALPPLAVTFASYGVGLFFDDDGIGWSPALWMALGVQVLGFALTALTGFNTQRANDLVAITAIHTLALGATVTLTLPWGKP